MTGREPLIEISYFILNRSNVAALLAESRDCAALFSMTAGMLVCYACGTLVYSHVSFGTVNLASLTASFSVCVLPFLAADFVKLVLAAAVSVKLCSLHIL